MRLEAFGQSKSFNRRSRARQLLTRVANDAGAFQKVIYAERRREARRASGRQYVVRAGEIISNRLRRIRADEDRAGVVYLGRSSFVVFGDDLDVFGRYSVGERARGGQRFDYDQRAEIGERAFDDLAARQASRLFDDLFAHGLGKLLARRDQDRRGVFGMFGLREQIGGDEIGARRVVGDDHNLARPGDGIDVNCAVYEFLRGGDVLIAGADDLVHAWDRLGPVSQSRDGLRAADGVDLEETQFLQGRRY